MKKLLLILSIILVAVVGWSQTKELAGVTGFRVLVSVQPDSLASLIPVSSIRTDVELRLRIARVPVLSSAQWFASTSAATIVVDVDGVRSATGLWAIRLSEECTQPATLGRDPNIITLGLTWFDGTVSLIGDSRVPDLRQDIKDSIDKLVNLYLAANP